MADITEFVGAKEAAEIIGCTGGRVRQLLREGTLKGKKITGNAWLIHKLDAEAIRDIEHETGRPRISKSQC